MQELDDQVLTLYVVYDSPDDYPGSYVVRPQHATRTKVVMNPICCIGQDLSVVRRPFVEQCLTRLERQPDDDVNIVEVWL